MPTTYVSAASWSQAVPVTGDGTLVVMVPTYAAKMGIAVATTGGTVTVQKTLGSPSQVAADSCTWSSVTVTSGEAVVDLPISALKITVSGGATGELFLIQ